MKHLLVLLAILGLSANAMADMKWGGSAWIGYVNTDNVDGDGDAADNDQDITQWIDLHTTITKGDSLSAYVKVRHLNIWGDTDNIDASADLKNTAVKNQSSVGNSLHIIESWAWWKMNDAWSLKFGRFNLELNDGELVSINAWEDIPRGFDGAAAIGEYAWGRVGVVGVRNADYDTGSGVTQITGTSDQSVVFWGLMYDMKNLPDALSRVNFQYISAMADRATSPSVETTKKSWLGAALKGEKGKVDYRFAAVSYSGESGTTDLGGTTMMDLEVGYGLNWKNSRIAFYYHADGGNDDDSTNGFEAYDPFHYKKHENAGRMDLVEWGKGKAGNGDAAATGLTEMALKFSAQLKESCSVDFSYHIFTETEDTNGDDESALGTEIDLGFQHNYDNGFYTRVEISQFTFGDGYGANMDDAATRFWVEGGFDF